MTSISDKIKFILESKVETENDIFIQLSLENIFTSQNSNSNDITIPEIKSNEFSEYINKFVDLLVLLFNKDKENRNSLYNKKSSELNDYRIKEIINRMDIFKEFKLNNEKYFQLYKVILSLIVKENLPLIEDIRAIIFNIAFVIDNNILLNTLLYHIIYNKFIYIFEINFSNGEDSQIVINNDYCLNLILKLFESEEKEDENFLLIFSILILRFESIEKTVVGLDYSLVKMAIINMLNKMKNDFNENDNLFVEKIISIFSEEIEEIIFNGNKSELHNEKIEENNINIIQEEPNYPVSENEITKNFNYNNNHDKIWDNNNSEYINDIFSTILNILNMEQIDKGKIIEHVNDLKSLVNRLIEDNKKLFEDNKKIKHDIDELQNQVKALKNETKDIKAVISHIQCRNLSKNFLQCFNKYLDEQDWAIIKKEPEKRAEIYTEKIQENCKNYLNNEKFKFILKLVCHSANSLTKGNSSAHSLEITYYNEQLGLLKDKKNINILENTKVLCFLIGIKIDIDSDLFDEAFDFLTSEKFDDSLNINSWRINDAIEYLLE